MNRLLQPTIERDGFTIIRGMIPPSAVEQGIALMEPFRPDAGGGARNLLSSDGVRDLAVSRALLDPVRTILGDDAHAVRGLFFDKTPGSNWQLGWHQDRAIAVRERHDVPGHDGWSIKAGVPHVFPPVEVLASMVTVRLHLDACDAAHGALQVLPGSHARGFLDPETLASMRGDPRVVSCDVEAGDAVVMRPLLAHASGRCERPGHRRVIHIEYAAAPLSPPLEWFDAVFPTRRSSAL